MTEVKGVVIIARNGDRFEMYQDPKDYSSALAQTTALGEAQSHQLGSLLRSIYLAPESSSFIKGVEPTIVDHKQLHVRVKAGGEGSVVFDSAIALLQGLYPPHQNNKIELANGTTIVAPLGGYQYVPVETVEPGNDHSLEPWTSCPNFQKHIAEFHSSEEYKKKEKGAEPFFNQARDFIFGREAKLQNIWNLHDFMNSQLMHNKTYAYRLPPGLISSARDLANFHEDGVFSDDSADGIGNIAGRTLLYTILSSLERFSAPRDPLKFVLVETSYHPFISLFHQFEIAKENPQLKGMPDFGSAFIIELRAGPPPDARDFLRFKFKNGTGGFETIHVLGHKQDIPVTEFVYRLESAAIKSNKQWAEICGAKSPKFGGSSLGAGIGETLEQAGVWPYSLSALLFFSAVVFALVFGVVQRTKTRAKAHRVRLHGEDTLLVSNVQRQSAEKVRYI